MIVVKTSSYKRWTLFICDIRHNLSKKAVSSGNNIIDVIIV